MNLLGISLKNFRNLNSDFRFSPGVNLIIGANGKGKTNLLESIYLLLEGKSFRTNREVNCIKIGAGTFGHHLARTMGTVGDALGNQNVLEVILEEKQNEFTASVDKILRVNKKKVSLPRFNRILSTVIFSPDTIDLIAGPPTLRRRDIDDFLTDIDASYLEILTNYRTVIRNRNKLLERFTNGASNDNELLYWNKRLIELGSEMIYKRLKVLKKIVPIINSFVPSILGKNSCKISIQYESKFGEKEELSSIKKALAKKIELNLAKEKAAGVTLYGPHREDFIFEMDGYNVKDFGSRGQQRICSFLYKLAEWELLKRKDGFYPALLLDDIFSELDIAVTKNINKFLEGCQSQIFLTALSTREIPKTLITNANLISL